MGNTWTGANDERLLETEKKMLEYSGIELSNFEIKNIVIDDEGNFVRTMEVGDVSNCLLIYHIRNKNKH